MKEVYTNIYVGNDSDCKLNLLDFKIVHACKTCHKRKLRYKHVLPKFHKNYLIYENENHLYLNIEDMDRELSPKYTDKIIKKFIEFLDRYLVDNKILIHCNQELSRSPSLALIYLANKKLIGQDSFDNAKEDFIKLYPNYAPGRGILLYMKNNWNKLISF